MVKGYRKVNIIVEAVTLNGTKCSNPEVSVLYVGECIDPNCAYNPKTKTIEAQVDDDCIDNGGNGCITYHVKCKEGDCIDAIITKCLCNDSSDCTLCENCINGICENKCTNCDDQECDINTGTCYGCNCPENPCVKSADCLAGSGNQDCVCIPLFDECRPCKECVLGSNIGCKPGEICKTIKTTEGKECKICTCPGDKKYCTENDTCQECCTSGDCPNCSECVAGKCVPGPCEICDPNLDCCVPCIGAGANTGCKKKNQCCYGTGCERYCDCCDGYTLNTCTGECVPVGGLCKNNLDCGNNPCTECLDIDPCTGYGKCTEKKCPVGQVCVYGKCQPICDCSTRNCSSVGSSSACVDHPTKPDVCYCYDCGIKECIDPEAVDCGPDHDKDACVCNKITDKCEPSLCNNSVCSGDFDCALGCTCYNSKCVSCSEFSCELEASAGGCGGATSRNCKCNDAGECVGDPDAKCNDTLTATKLASCEIKGKWTSDDCCTCPDITVNVRSVRTSNNQVSFIYELYKGSVVDPKLKLGNDSNDSIADSEEPTEGALTYDVINDIILTTYQLDANGNRILSSGTSVNTTEVNPVGDTPGAYNSFNVVDTTLQTGQYTPVNGEEIKISDSVYKELTDKTYNVKIQEQFYFGQTDVKGQSVGTKCRYGVVNKPIITFKDSEIGSSKTYTLKSSACRPVYFIWKQDNQSFRKVYIDQPYEDIVGWDEGLRPCKKITLSADCGCVNPANSDSEFCNPVDLATAEALDVCRKRFLVTINPACKLNVLGNVKLEIDFGQEIVAPLSGDNFTISGTKIIHDLSLTGATFEVELASSADSVNTQLICN